MEKDVKEPEKKPVTRVEQFELTMVIHGSGEDDYSQGTVVVKEDGEVEFEDCSPISIDNLDFVMSHAKKFISWRKRVKND